MLQKLQIARVFVMIFTLGSVMTQVCAQGSPILYASSANRTMAAAGLQTYSLVDLLKDLEAKYNVVFDYDKKALKGKHITISKDQLTAEDVGATLNTILPPLGLQYKKYSERSYIIFEPKEIEEPKKATQENGAQTMRSSTQPGEIFTQEQAASSIEDAAFTVSGTVKDDLGTTMPGVNVVIKGTTVGTSTDSDGKYTLEVPDGNGIIVFSFIGYETQEVPVSNRTVIDISMLPDISTLSEVVVVGFGTVKKRDLTGSVASMKSEEITRTPTHNAVEALQGKVAGMDIVRSSGAAGATTNVVIRGNKSITDKDKMVDRNSPLYIVDGNQLPLGSNIGDLNPSDIESIDVLKDASATAIYGALGANGVVIITTKKGAEGKVKISYNGYYGVNYYSFPKGRTGDSYRQLRREAYRATDPSQWSSPADDINLFPDTNERQAYEAGQWVDWVDLIKQNGLQQSHSVSIAGGTDKTRIFSSIGYFREEGMLRNNDYSRYNARFNLDQTLSKWAKAGIVTQLTYSVQNNRFDPFSKAISVSPLGDVYDDNGQYNTFSLTGVVSPLADERTNNMSRDNIVRANILSNGYLELTPIKGLTFRTTLGTNLTFSRRGIYNDKLSFSNARNGISTARAESTFDRFYNWDNVLTFTKDIADHTITVTGITSYLRSDKDVTVGAGTKQLDASQLFYALDGTIPSSMGSPYTGWKNMAYAGRLSYSYKGKYLLTATGRYDGASRLSPGNKWAFFPSVAVGWNVIDEVFLQNVTAISNLKVRGSYGVSGNYSIDVYGTQSGLVPGRNMSFGEVAAPMYQFKPGIGNPDLGWETSTTTDIGIDVGVMKERITATVDLYDTKTTDILMKRTLPQSSGVGFVYQNIAATQNRGIEVTVSSKNIDNGSFKWNTTLTFFSNREKITDLIDGKDIIVSETESLLLGRPINSFYTFDKQGIWQTSEADVAVQYHAVSATGNTFKPGDIKSRDLNGDFIISAEHDRTYVGSSVPKWVAGLQNNFYYKGFDLSIFAMMRYGQTIDSEFLGGYNPSGEGNGIATLDYWTPENPTNDYPRPLKGTTLSTNTGYTGYQALRFVDGSFFKIRTATVGYTLPANLLEKLSISRVRFYVTGTNLWIKAKSHLLKNYDPERGGAANSPLSRQLVFGVNVDF